MSYIQFESSKVKDAERQALREAREKLLTEAEAAHNRRKARAERARERGDDKWMLPSVEAKLWSNDCKKKKRKKEKKAKKSKKKEKKRSKSSSSSDSTEDEGEEWVEKGAETSATTNSPKVDTLRPEKPLERDEWMNLPGSFLCSSQDQKRKKKDEEEKERRDSCMLSQPGQNRNELNPYWKDGGTGVPEVEDKKPKLMDATWLKKSLQRAKEQAAEEGKSLEEIATERWGSLDAINSMIEEAERNSRQMYGSRHSSANESRRDWSSRRDYDRERPRRSNDDDKHRKNREMNNSDRDERSRRSEGHRSRSRSRERSGGRSRDRESDREFFKDRRKLAFRKPDEHESSSSSASKSSCSVKRWQKPAARDRIAEEHTREARRAKSPPDRCKKSDSDRSDSEHDEKNDTGVNREKSETEKILTEAELNQLGAKIIKAEIMGDTELAQTLKAKLEMARESRKNPPVISPKKMEEENVILTTTNARGMARPLEPRSGAHQEPTGGRRKGKKVSTHESGQRVRYFADDDRFTLQEMFQREKGQTSAENDAAFVKMASKSMDMDELFEQRITREESNAKQDERDRSRAIVDHQKQANIMARCSWCFDSDKLLKHMIVAMGAKCYVSLPPHASLTTGHCVLTPIQHVSCQTQLDEDVWEELQNFKKAITRMFMDKKEFPVFFEVFAGQHRYPHMQLECVPLPEEVGSMAPIYFKKALSECEMEWSTNKKVIDLSKKNVREAIPKGLPYFAVSFGNHGGFAHVIEDEKLFPRNFAQEIIGGMLDLDHSLWRRPRRENFDQQRQKVLQFAAAWKPYELTLLNDSN